MPYTLDHDAIANLDGCLPLLSNVLGPAVSTCVWFREVQSGDATSINCNDVTFRQMTQNVVILPGCPKAEKRIPPFPSSSRATLRQRPPGNRRRHKTLARTMGRAILGDRNSRENLVNFFVVKVTISLSHRGGVRVVFFRTFLVHVWRKCRGADCFCRQIIYSTPRADLFCAICTSWSVAKYCRLCW